MQNKISKFGPILNELYENSDLPKESLKHIIREIEIFCRYLSFEVVPSFEIGNLLTEKL